MPIATLYDVHGNIRALGHTHMYTECEPGEPLDLLGREEAIALFESRAV